eukprot:g36873.t1
MNERTNERLSATTCLFWNVLSATEVVSSDDEVSNALFRPVGSVRIAAEMMLFAAFVCGFGVLYVEAQSAIGATNDCRKCLMSGFAWCSQMAGSGWCGERHDLRCDPGTQPPVTRMHDCPPNPEHPPSKPPPTPENSCRLDAVQYCPQQTGPGGQGPGQQRPGAGQQGPSQGPAPRLPEIPPYVNRACQGDCPGPTDLATFTMCIKQHGQNLAPECMLAMARWANELQQEMEGGVLQACFSEGQRLCPNQDGISLLECLRRKVDDTSEDCKAALRNFAREPSMPNQPSQPPTPNHPPMPSQPPAGPMPLLWQACVQDLHTLCPDQAQNPAGAECLQVHYEQLSMGCAAALNAWKAMQVPDYVQRACRMDAQALCAGLEMGAPLMACLSQHYADLTQTCTEALATWKHDMMDQGQENTEFHLTPELADCLVAHQDQISNACAQYLTDEHVLVATSPPAASRPPLTVWAAALLGVAVVCLVCSICNCARRRAQFGQVAPSAVGIKMDRRVRPQPQDGQLQEQAAYSASSFAAPSAPPDNSATHTMHSGVAMAEPHNNLLSQQTISSEQEVVNMDQLQP